MDVAARLRERELASVRVQAENGLRESALKGLDERGRAQELVRQQYTGRYLSNCSRTRTTPPATPALEAVRTSCSPIPP